MLDEGQKTTSNLNMNSKNMAQGTDAGRVVGSSFNLWIPRITPEDSLIDSFVD